MSDNQVDIERLKNASVCRIIKELFNVLDRSPTPVEMDIGVIRAALDVYIENAPRTPDSEAINRWYSWAKDNLSQQMTSESPTVQ